ncbi:uncharacterized protein MELLADRAFT_62720 [Melampsora larici-populina 98AG31]|uniref:DUF7918 domain-containing protein n=1 Tax=Melampsora larici-populina (strain 98AG31 / pathotype 3-4-7) TaxID=747676 RepID=F4RJY8_MELLP|nr:uncharacterized protein MELLADRAFT_62720 [Melampsora larici-populina 98AG31]EGG07395.1 hypothetical protein MELLADRAFT_62720 [Melampsora larici-populina 98AG31]
MPQANGIQVNLICNGTPLTEYPKPSSTPNIVFCESTPGQTFQVQLLGPKATSDCLIKLYCDGVYIKSCSYPRRECLSKTFQGIYAPNDPTKLMPFKFSNIELSEEDQNHSEQIVKNLGTVSLEFFHCKFGLISKTNKTKKNSIKSIPSLASANKFSERNKKASMIPHTISLGDPITVDRSGSSTSRPRKQIDSTPYLRFVWHYRSRNLLTTAGLIPQPATPLPDIQRPRPTSVAHRNDETRAVQGQKARVKEAKETKPDIKPKASGSKLKTSGSQSVVIDLCDGDDETTSFFSSTLDNPITLDDDDAEVGLVISSSERVLQASGSSSRQIDTKPVKIESEKALKGHPKEKKRVQAKVEVKESDRKRVKLEMVAASLNEKR